VEQDLSWEANYSCLNIVLVAKGRMMKWVGYVIRGTGNNCAQNFVRKNVNNVHEHITRVSYPLLNFTYTDRASLRQHSLCGSSRVYHLGDSSIMSDIFCMEIVTFVWGADMF
jgi:hypothetical protein